MAVIVKTNEPNQLLESIKFAIDLEKVKTWSYDSDGDFMHSPPQWERKAWMRPCVEDDELVFYIVPPQRKRISKTIYGVYHGRLIEMLLTHFDELFTQAFATALPYGKDKVRGNLA